MRNGNRRKFNVLVSLGVLGIWMVKRYRDTNNDIGIDNVSTVDGEICKDGLKVKVKAKYKVKNRD